MLRFDKETGFVSGLLVDLIKLRINKIGHIINLITTRPQSRINRPYFI